jgi:ubiquinone/menaquinone biosynthesis C-methylase UbiE
MGTADPDASVDEQRDEALARLRSTYRHYSESGYASRWSSGGIGAQLVVVERDDWLAEVVGAGPTVLDLGCGSGDLGVMLASRGQRPQRYLGLDLLEERIALARASVPWGEFIIGSADRLPLTDSSVDVVVAATLFSSLRESFLQRAVADEIGRVLRPGGRLAVYDLRYPSPRNRAVVPITRGRLEHLFPGWWIRARTITLLPPLARSVLGAGDRRYRTLARVPFLRSHVAALLERP